MLSKPCPCNADKVDSKLFTLWMSHICMRASLCDLWLLGEATETYYLESVVLPLTSETSVRHINIPPTNGVLGVQLLMNRKIKAAAALLDPRI